VQGRLAARCRVLRYPAADHCQRDSPGGSISRLC
jgi:hypothetical protein